MWMISRVRRVSRGSRIRLDRVRKVGRDDVHSTGRGMLAEADSRQQTADSRRQTAASRQQTADKDVIPDPLHLSALAP